LIWLFKVKRVTHRRIPIYETLFIGKPWNRELRYDRHLEQQNTMRGFATATGGIVCANFNDLARCFERAAVDSSAYYLLGFYISPDDHKPGWRKLKVEVACEAKHVRAREGFYVGVPPKDGAEERRSALAAALTSPVEFTGVIIEVQWIKRIPGNPDSRMISATLSVTLPAPLVLQDDPGGGVLDLLFAAVALDGKGNNLAEISRKFKENLDPESVGRIRKAGLEFQGEISYPAGTKEIRFAIRNNIPGATGSVIASVEAP
jgi:hypothetical protein